MHRSAYNEDFFFFWKYQWQSSHSLWKKLCFWRERRVFPWISFRCQCSISWYQTWFNSSRGKIFICHFYWFDQHLIYISRELTYFCQHLCHLESISMAANPIPLVFHHFYIKDKLEWKVQGIFLEETEVTLGTIIYPTNSSKWQIATTKCSVGLIQNQGTSSSVHHKVLHFFNV